MEKIQKDYVDKSHAMSTRLLLFRDYHTINKKRDESRAKNVEKLKFSLILYESATIKKATDDNELLRSFNV